MDNKTLAAALINTRTLPPGLGELQALANEARAYNMLDPYPVFWFRDWKTEDRGPLPRCLPLAKSIVARGARWLFGKPLQINVAGNETLETFLRTAWDKNRMATRLPAIARDGALDGGVALKFSYDETNEKKLLIQSLSIVDQVRMFYDPHDRDSLLMARVQYPYFDAQAGKTFWYREEWTNEEEVHYVPVADEQLKSTYAPGKNFADTYEGWQIDTRETNPFGLIPVVHIKNIDNDNVWGLGDLWDLYRVLDRIHLTYHLMDRSNQFDSDHNPIFIDADLDEQDIDRPLQPGQPLALESKEGEHQAKVHFPEARGSLRPAMMEYAKELGRQILSAAGSVDVDSAEITNKGNLTSAVLQQIYMPLIEATEEKRKSYGTDGIARFLATAARGLQNARVDLGVTDAEVSYKVELAWPEHFLLSQDELAGLTARTQEQVVAQFLTQDRATERIAQAEGIQDNKVLVKELEAEPAPTPTAVDPTLVTAQQMNSAMNSMGGNGSK